MLPIEVNRTLRGWKWSESAPNPSAHPISANVDPKITGLYGTPDYALGRFVSGSGDKTLRIWNTAGECEHVLTGHTGAVLAVATTEEGWIVSGGQDRTVRVWKMRQTLSGQHEVKRVMTDLDIRKPVLNLSHS